MRNNCQRDAQLHDIMGCGSKKMGPEARQWSAVTEHCFDIMFKHIR